MSVSERDFDHNTGSNYMAWAVVLGSQYILHIRHYKEEKDLWEH